MQIKIVEAFRDKNEPDKAYTKGMTATFSEARAKELILAGVAEAIAEKKETKSKEH